MNLINNFYTLEIEEIDYKDTVTGMNKVMISKKIFLKAYNFSRYNRLLYM